jgi:site-specific DNA-methyltransferase (adenine-specific)
LSQEILIHPAAEISPPLEGEAFEALCDLLKRFGDIDQIDPILGVRVPEADGTLNGKVQLLSGRSKFAALKRLGIEPKIHIYPQSEGKSLAELAASINILRRHLTASQRAAAGVTVEQQFAAEAKKRQQAAGGDRKTAVGASESLLIKLSKAILAKDCSDNYAALARTPPVQILQIHNQIFGLRLGGHLKHEVMVADIFNELKREKEPVNAPGEMHARKKAAQICDVSEAYIGQAKVVFESDRALFTKLLSGGVSLGQAKSEVRRQVKRNANVPTGPLEKPRDSKGLSGIRDGDCNKILPTLPRRKFRLVFADPPYNIGVDYGNGSKSDKLPDAEYLAIHQRWIGQLGELLTPDGCCWVLINNEYAAEFVIMLKRAGMKMRAWVKWYETFGTNCSNNFNRTSRHLLYFVRDPKRVVFDEDVFQKPSARKAFYGDRRAVRETKMWDDVWDIPRLVGSAKERIPDFPTQLPEALLRPIIEGCTEEGDLVIDPFSGSGTTAAVCKMTGRDCLGIEINAEYAAWSRARVERTAVAKSS